MNTQPLLLTLLIAAPLAILLVVPALFEWRERRELRKLWNARHRRGRGE